MNPSLRQRLETLLGKTASDNASLPTREVRDCLPELLGLQTELERQNTDLLDQRKLSEENLRSFRAELLAANNSLEESRRAALNLMDEALAARKQAEWLARFPLENPEPVLRVSAECQILFFNPAAHKAGWTGPDDRTLAPSLRSLIHTALASRNPVNQDVELGGKTYAVAVVLFPEEKYVNLYGRDITERTRAQEAIILAKQEWERTFDSVPDLIAILNDQHQIIRVNHAMARKLGCTPQECIGQTCFQLVHGCEGPHGLCPHSQTLQDGQEHTIEIQEKHLGGDFLITTTPLKDATGRMTGTVHVAHDITERKQRENRLHRLNRALHALSHSGQALVRATSETTFLKEACQIIVQDCGYALVWIGLAEHDPDQSIRAVAYAGFEAGYLETLNLTWSDTERGRGPTGTAIRTGQVCRCPRLLTDPSFQPWREEALKRGYASSLALPLIDGDQVLGALMIYAREAEGFLEEEVGLLQDLAADFTHGIVVLRSRAAKEQAETDMRESEERYRTLFSTMTEGFALHEIICDPNGTPCDYRFLDINPAFEHLTGLKRDEVVGKNVLAILPGTEPTWIERFGRVALTGQSDHFEHLSAELGRHYEVTVFQTAPHRFAVIFNDVTALKAMQQREREAAIQLAWGRSAIDTVNAMREGVLLLEKDGAILSVNPAAEELTGFARGALVGRNLKSLLPQFLMGTDLNTALGGWSNWGPFRIPKVQPLLLTRPDGKTFHVLPSLSQMKAPDGGRKVIVLTLKDVTDLYEATQQLERNEQKYRELVENANSIIMRITPDHTITFFNEYAQAFFGYTAPEVLGRNVVETIVPEVDSEGQSLRMLLQDITDHPEQHANNENENLCKDGRRVWVHWSNRAIRDPQGNVIEILCVGTDITGRRQMETEARRYQQRLRVLSQRLAAAEEEDRWRISRYIHDTIIQNLSLSSIRLGSMTKPLADAQLTTESQKLRQIRELIDQATDECRMVMSDLTPALLYELGLIPALNDLAHKIETKHGVRILVEEEGQEQNLSNSMRGLLFQSVRELIMNALKHAGACSIRVSVQSTDRNLTLRVTDTGVGFNPAAPPSPSRHSGGFGLLNIRQRLEGFNGRLEIESAPGWGTTATISLPLAQEPPGG